MVSNILKIGLILGVASIVWAERVTRVSATLLEGCYNQVDTSPFERVGNNLYYFGPEKLSWFAAFLKCRTLGSFLASLEDSAQLAALSEHLTANYAADRWWWLSGSDLDTKGKFFWFRTGEAFNFTDWSSGQPDNAGGNEDCVHLWRIGTKYQMNDWICKQPAYYICQADNPKTVAVSLF